MGTNPLTRRLWRRKPRGICRLGRGNRSWSIARLGMADTARSCPKPFDENGRLIGIDRDEDALRYCEERFQDVRFAVRLVRNGFEELDSILDREGVKAADAILFDLGFSSPEVDTPERGFSFMREGPLDMRMDRRQELTAQEIIAGWEEQPMADLFKRFGEERFARRIAKAIVRRRRESAIETTQDLADVVTQAIPAAHRKQEGLHPATRVFQALRIFVNDELEALRTGLGAALNRLKPGGRVAVLSYHSLEHRIVKELYREYCGRCVCPPGLPQCGCGAQSKGLIVTRKPVKPCTAERERNPRSRSAQLRVLERFSETVGEAHG